MTQPQVLEDEVPFFSYSVSVLTREADKLKLALTKKSLDIEQRHAKRRDQTVLASLRPSQKVLGTVQRLYTLLTTNRTTPCFKPLPKTKLRPHHDQ